MSGRIDSERFERLIRAIEAQTNAINRLVQVMEHKRSATTTKARSARQRRVVIAERPVNVTPAVEAAVNLALARHSAAAQTTSTKKRR